MPDGTQGRIGAVRRTLGRLSRALPRSVPGWLPRGVSAWAAQQLRLLAGRDVLATLLPLLVVGIAGSGLSWQYQAALRRDRELVAHTWQVIAATDDLVAAATNAETGQRGYVITGDPAFLAPYEQARTRLPGLAARARDLLIDNPSQLARLDRLLALLTGKLHELAAGIALRREQGFEAARALVAGGAGRDAMDAARKLSDDMELAERALLEDRTDRVRRRERWVTGVGIAAAVLSILTRGALRAWLKRRRTAADA